MKENESKELSQRDPSFSPLSYLLRAFVLGPEALSPSPLSPQETGSPHMLLKSSITPIGGGDASIPLRP